MRGTRRSPGAWLTLTKPVQIPDIERALCHRIRRWGAVMRSLRAVGSALAVVGTLFVAGSPASATPIAGYYDISVLSEGESSNSTSCIAIDPYDCGKWRLAFSGNTNDPLSFQYVFTFLSNANMDPNDLAPVCPRFWCGGDGLGTTLSLWEGQGTRTAEATFDAASRSLFIKVRFEFFPSGDYFSLYETELSVSPGGGYFTNIEYFCGTEYLPPCGYMDSGGAAFSVDDFRRTRIPEPSTLAVFGTGVLTLFGFGVIRRRGRSISA